MENVIQMKALYLSGAVVYKKDKDGKKTEEVSSYIARFAEVCFDKNDKMYLRIEEKFVYSQALPLDKFKALKPFDLCVLDFSIKSITSQPVIVGLYVSTEKDHKIEVYY